MGNKVYTEDSIQSLSPLQFTRLRPGVYCGSTEYSTQLLIEIVSNAIDEFKAGHGDTIKVDINKDNVIIVEDIVDSGNTLSQLVPILKAREPKSLKVCTLLDKPDRRTAPIDVDYNGFVIPDEFVVGYGLDYDQKYRNLPYIGVLHFE